MFNKSLVQRNHAMEKPSVEMPAVAAFLIKEFGECAALGQLAEGEESRAFAFQANDNPYVLRISRSAGGFHKDAFAYCAFSGPALPIPEIVRIGILMKISAIAYRERRLALPFRICPRMTCRPSSNLSPTSWTSSLLPTFDLWADLAGSDPMASAIFPLGMHI